MNLVYEYVWYVIGAAGFLGFVIAWLVRGAMLAGKRRRSTVERDIAVTELEQVRSELDSLYAAQRKQKEVAGSGGGNSEGEIRERDERIQKMSDELAAAKAALQSLKEGDGSDHQPAADTKIEQDLENAKSRNEFLEGRIRELEAKVHEMGQAPVPAEPAIADNDAADDENEKLLWQVDYLKSRVAALEDQAVKSVLVSPAVSDAAPAADTSAADEELARLRWRNRYLEGRLAYFEEKPETEEAHAPEPADESDDPLKAKDVSPAPELVPDLETDVTEAVAEEEFHPPTETETDEEPAIEDVDRDDDTHPADRVLEALDAKEAQEAADEADASDEDEGEGAGEEVELSEEPEDEAPQNEGERPPAIDAPKGDADDLTLITGIGPRIQTILNDYGIWHFSQIAEWSADNEAWIDRELNFAGRVSREGWIDQARQLAGVTSDT